MPHSNPHSAASAARPGCATRADADRSAARHCRCAAGGRRCGRRPTVAKSLFNTKWSRSAKSRHMRLRDASSGWIEAPAVSSADEQLQLQAEQLAVRLSAQQEQIDRRESDLNAQLAQQEHDARSARLWLRERQQELADRQAELAARERDIATRQEELARADREQAEARQRAKAEQRRQSEAFAQSPTGIGRASAMPSIGKIRRMRPFRRHWLDRRPSNRNLPNG